MDHPDTPLLAVALDAHLLDEWLTGRGIHLIKKLDEGGSRETCMGGIARGVSGGGSNRILCETSKRYANSLQPSFQAQVRSATTASFHVIRTFY